MELNEKLAARRRELAEQKVQAQKGLEQRISNEREDSVVRAVRENERIEAEVNRRLNEMGLAELLGKSKKANEDESTFSVNKNLIDAEACRTMTKDENYTLLFWCVVSIILMFTFFWFGIVASIGTAFYYNYVFNASKSRVLEKARSSLDLKTEDKKENAAGSSLR